MKVYIGNDHAGYRLKKLLMQERPNIQWKNYGVDSEDRADYPDYADLVSKSVSGDSNSFGVLICGSGQGMAMRANKYQKIRAALCVDEESSQLARAHNDANILCLGARFLHHDEALKILDVFLATQFEGGRHAARVKKIENPC